MSVTLSEQGTCIFCSISSAKTAVSCYCMMYIEIMMRNLSLRAFCSCKRTRLNCKDLLNYYFLLFFSCKCTYETWIDCYLGEGR